MRRSRVQHAPGVGGGPVRDHNSFNQDQQILGRRLDFASAERLCARDITLGHQACRSKTVRYGFEIPRAERKLFRGAGSLFRRVENRSPRRGGHIYKQLN